ncbi:uncharacterized protein EI90DRAFT_3062451 [Cantharellus anzutake]|uniref:uncharacterized protein n=1 Tax=Cantharellus anzutake TaxID=1750568 RepID=UPI001905777B|nr:uncharacterized protein EI90DRAFT_3062451 [Cantharellus anzutake]KAF8329386.1 hypothetical protein EI90DRAFT_3062451 [Cantharellus anzutake]
MAEDGIYITHLRPTNLTWRAVDSIWTPMKVGERAKLTHKDILCFGTAPKSKSHGNRVDAPFIVSIAFVPVGDEVSWTKYKFVKKTIHRPYQHMTKQKEMDAGMQLLLNDLNGLNVSPGQVGTGEHEGDTPTASKRKRGAPSEPDAERSDESTIRHSRDPSRSEQSKFVTEDASKKRRLPGSSSSPYCEDAVDLPDTLTKMTLS